MNAIDAPAIYSRPRVVILLAVFNGEKWLDEQISSILGQTGVDVQILASDDYSSDGSAALLAKYEAAHRNFKVTVPRERCGSAGRNFYHLMAAAGDLPADYFAFCDQDDIWLPTKLSQQITQLEASQAIACSTAVVEFTDYANYKFLTNYPRQTEFDFLFQSAGQGCTFVFRPLLLELFRVALQTVPVERIVHHDWLLYALARSHRQPWIILDQGTLLYRQHGRNEVGGRSGIQAVLKRVRKVRSGWFGEQVRLIAQAATAATTDARISNTCTTLIERAPGRRLSLLKMIPSFRRDLKGKLALCFFILAGLI